MKNLYHNLDNLHDHNHDRIPDLDHDFKLDLDLDHARAHAVMPFKTSSLREVSSNTASTNPRTSSAVNKGLLSLHPRAKHVHG